MKHRLIAERNPNSIKAQLDKSARQLEGRRSVINFMTTLSLFGAGLLEGASADESRDRPLVEISQG